VFCEENSFFVFPEPKFSLNDSLPLKCDSQIGFTYADLPVNANNLLPGCQDGEYISDREIKCLEDASEIIIHYP